MQKADRRKFLGASDAAAVLGLSRWKTPIQLWAEKTGAVEPPDISDELRIKLGLKLEDTVAELFTEATGKKLRRVNEHKVHKKYDFICAQIDRIVEGEDAVCELKTASGWKAKEWSGEDIPREYEIQVMHQLAVTGRKVGYIAVLIGNQDFKWKIIERDDAVIDRLIQQEVHFWIDYVIPNVMPEQITADDSDVLYQLYPEVTAGESVSMPDKANILIEQIQSLSQDKISTEKQIDQCKNELKALLKDREEGHTSLWKVTWKEQVSKRLDTKLLKEQLPEAYYKYAKETKSRVLRYRQITKEED